MLKYKNKLILLSMLSLANGVFAKDLSVEKIVFGEEKSSEAAAAVSPVPMCCYSNSRPERISVRHIESKGIGYNQGYSTLEGFFMMPAAADTIWFPFLDLRGHVFNNGKFAANAGLGLRYLSESRVWGINSYYDYRQATHRNFSQYGLGLESLGRVWDFRVNGYLPVGKKESNYYHYGTTFEGFKGNSLLVSRKQKIAFKGINAEAGVHAALSDDILFYAAAGPYYFNHHTLNAWGGEVRVALDFTKYVRLEGNTSYDNIFKWIGQGQLSLNFPFGPKQKISVRRCNTCCDEVMLRDRVVQRVDRDEIIVLDSRRTKTAAIDPATGLPYVFIFVNNTSSSNGTFESPYPTLALAEANSAPSDIIYVFEGNGAYTLSNSMTLQDNQKLWGASLQYQLSAQGGLITIPATSAGLPQVSLATLGSTAGIILGNNNEVAGMNFTGNFTGEAIFGGSSSGFGVGITNANIHDNHFSSVGSSAAIQLTNCFGDLIVVNNQMANADYGISILNENVSNMNSNVVISNNNILNSGIYGVGVTTDAPSGTMQLLIENNTVDGSVTANIAVGSTITGAGQMVCGIIQGNTATNSLSGIGIEVALYLDGSENFSVDIINNTCTGNMGAFGDFLIATESGSLCVNFSGNTSGAYTFLNNAGVMHIVDLANVPSNNTGTENLYPTAPITSVESCSCQ